ncbi:nitroreductase family protein [Candidatus Woesearchaeota archaeon]|nr:nitroreductase family protein [Candidatus Woesearchaeota archaeon]
MTKTINQRAVEHNIDPLFAERWSPRAMNGDFITDEQLSTLFEAARWAPSSYNEQPWRFLYAKRGTKNWDTFFGLMGEFNQSWTNNAAVLVVIVSKKTFTHNTSQNVVHSFDAGAAWENLALQATRMGLVTHGMAGFDYEKARKELKVPEDFTIDAMVAIGKHGKKDMLPKEMQEREFPSDRKKVSEIAWEGGFK